MEAMILPRLCRYHFRKVTRHLRQYILENTLHFNESVDSLTQNVRTLSTSSSASKHICVVGSGPAGFYTSQQLLKVGHLHNICQFKFLLFSEQNYIFLTNYISCH